MSAKFSNPGELWASCLEIIRANISLQCYKTWFEPIRPLRLEGSSLTIEVPSQFFYEWIEEHYITLLRNTLRRFLGKDAKLEYSIIVHHAADPVNAYKVKIPNVQGDFDKRNPTVSMPLQADKPVPSPYIIPGLKKITVDPQLNPLYNFSNFVESQGNMVARNAGLNIAMHGAAAQVNPLFIYGGFGLGKTHLVQAIGNEIRKRWPERAVHFTQSEKFINQYMESVKTHSSNELLNFYQVLDVLILDDVQYFMGKGKTQEQLLHVFNHLHQEGKQIIFTSDVHPNEMKNVEEKLLSRFMQAGCIELTMPDLDARIEILNRKMYAEGINIPVEVTEYVASQITSNVRELEGAMISLIAHSSFSRQEISLELAEKIVRKFVKNSNREITIDQTQKIVAEYFNVDIAKLKDKTRKREIVTARQVAMYFCKHFTKHSLKSIGSHFGGRDHSTVIHAINTVENLMSWDRDYKKGVEEVRKTIQKFRGEGDSEHRSSSHSE